ncbi:TetR/AcrR family transcriptional regulator [Georgenia sp. TF02-10]|uniref:TetR/AcrR family transcriptional regulator n=1 Tax=Georgenia sp. TF02-10 TaxID=2917725 RepID=UPI001FA7F493|nr:TetR/AcrR family transcriptional regulator [Georgenia sp. TF02-10]UNX56315.1 TetR/AcrR family transcriptional regulator [Georgenia sp. TF02-10]
MTTESPEPANGGRVYGGEAPADRAARRRRQLMDAGLELFGTVGFRKTTVRQLCGQARVADRYFYEEFNGTEDLLLAVYDECHHRLRQAVADAWAGVPPTEPAHIAVAAGLDSFLAYVEQHPPLARLVWFEILGVSRAVESRHIQRLSEFGELIGRLVETRGGTIVAVGAARSVLLTAVAGGVSQVTMAWIDENFATARDELVSSLVPYVVGASTFAPATA